MTLESNTTTTCLGVQCIIVNLERPLKNLLYYQILDQSSGVSVVLVPDESPALSHKDGALHL